MIKKDLQITTDSALVWNNFDLSYCVTDTEKVAQKLQIKMKHFLGESFLNITLGLPYSQEIFQKNPNMVFIESAYKKEILDTDGVAEIIQFSLEINSALRRLDVTWKVKLTSGEIITGAV